MFRTIPQIADDQAADTRRRLDAATIAGALARGELRLTGYERLLRLSSRYQAHKAAGRVRAARACKEMAMRIVDQMEGN